MIRKIKNVYDYIDYRILLSDDFMARSSNNYSYSLRAYSRDLSLSPGFLSDLLRGNKDLSPAKGRKVFSTLSFDEAEVDYIEKLIIFKSSTDESQKQDAHNFIQSRFNKTSNIVDNSKDLILKSFIHLIVYGLTKKINDLSSIFSVTDQLELNRTDVQTALNEFVTEKYITEIDGQYFLSEINLTVRNNEFLLPTMNSLSNHMSHIMKKMGPLTAEGNVAHGFILGLNQQSHELAIEAHRHYVKSLSRIAAQPSEVDRFVFISDFFLVIKMPSDSNQSSGN